MTDTQQTVGAAPEGTCEAVGSAPTFREELEHIINRHSKENGSNTPDYMLADFLCTCLVAFDATVNARDRWYSIAPRPGSSGPNAALRGGEAGGGHAMICSECHNELREAPFFAEYDKECKRPMCRDCANADTRLRDRTDADPVEQAMSIMPGRATAPAPFAASR